MVRRRPSRRLYATTLSGLFGVSALYYLGRWRPVAWRMLQRADHVMILLAHVTVLCPFLYPFVEQALVNDDFVTALARAARCIASFEGRFQRTQ